MKDLDTDKVAEIIRHVSATEVMPRFRNLTAVDIQEKSPGDIVTAADEAAEKVLSQLLQDLLPEAFVVGEEAVAKDTSVLNRLKDEKPVWVIDPIDGTTNYAHGRDRFGIFISLLQNGITQYGWAFDAPGNRMAIAEKGAGSFLEGKRLSVTCTATDLKQLIGQGDGAPAKHFDPVRALFKDIVKSGCALHDYMNFVSGKSDFIVYVDRITPWDHAAANLIAAEAGAYIAMDKNGSLYDPTHFRQAFMLAAPTKAWWHQLHPILYPLHI
jgi:fructose-1,6-bisphosphatase/inositol monophosphatase family enzyme